MATKLLHKRGTSDPSASDLDVGEIGINTTDGGIFTKTSGGSVVEAGGGGSGGGGVSSDSQYNTVAGTDAGSSFTGTSAEKNTLFGYHAGKSITSADENSLFGYKAGEDITSGGRNTIIGNYSGERVTTQSGNTFLGDWAASENVGSNNVALGASTMKDSGTGSSCVAVGGSALYNNHNGTANIGIGSSALYSLWGQPKDYNIGIGVESLRNSTGDYNIGIGRKAGIAGTSTPLSGQYNILIGNYSGNSISTGSDNTLLGEYAGGTLTTGSNNLILGHEAEPSAATVSNEVTVGNTSITKVRIPGINVVLKDNGGTPTDGHVLTVDSNGEAGFAAASGGGGATINNNADNRIITGSGTSGTLEAESTLTYTPNVGTNYVMELNGQNSYVKVGPSSSGQYFVRNNNGTTYTYHGGGNTWHMATTAGGRIQFDTVSKVMANMVPNAEVSLYHNNVKQIETTTTGVEVFGGIIGLKNTGSQSELRLYCESSNAHYAALKAPAHSDFSGNLTFTLPGGYGSNNQVLTSDGSGGMSWTTPAASTSYTAGTGLTLTSNAFSLVYGNSSSNTIRKITTSTSAPSGGSDGDIWIKHN